MKKDKEKPTTKPTGPGTIKQLKKTVSPLLLAKMVQDWEKESVGFDVLSERYDIPENLVELYIKKEFVNKNSSRYERLSMTFDGIFDSLTIAQQCYQQNPNNFNANSYIGMVNALRGALSDLDSIQSKEDLSQEIINFLINPLINKVTHSIINEFGNLKKEIMGRYKEEEADRIVTSMVQRVGIQFKSLLEDTVEKLENLLSAKEKNKKKILSKKGNGEAFKLVKGGKDSV